MWLALRFKLRVQSGFKVGRQKVFISFFLIFTQGPIQRYDTVPPMVTVRILQTMLTHSISLALPSITLTRSGYYWVNSFPRRAHRAPKKAVDACHLILVNVLKHFHSNIFLKRQNWTKFKANDNRSPTIRFQRERVKYRGISSNPRASGTLIV